MATNLLDMVTRSLTPELTSALAKAAGTTDSTVGSVSGALMPALLGALAQKTNVADGARNLFSLLTGANVDANIGSTLTNLLGSGQQSSVAQAGQFLVSSLFGDRENALVNALGQLPGANAASGRSLLMMLAPLALGVIKKFIVGNRLDADGTAALLREQSQFLGGRVNEKLAAALGLAPVAAARAAAPAVAVAPAPVVAAKSGGFGRLLPWLIAAAVALFLLSQLGKCSTAKAPEPAPAPAAAPAPAPAPVEPAPASAPVAAAPVAVDMPQKVYFETGKADIGADGQTAVKNAAAWATGDAARKVAITGYTDKQGSSDANEKLAKDRAIAVRDALKAAGVAEDRIEMKPPLFVERGAASGSGGDAEARRVEISAN